MFPSYTDPQFLHLPSLGKILFGRACVYYNLGIQPYSGKLHWFAILTFMFPVIAEHWRGHKWTFKAAGHCHRHLHPIPSAGISSTLRCGICFSGNQHSCKEGKMVERDYFRQTSLKMAHSDVFFSYSLLLPLLLVMVYTWHKQRVVIKVVLWQKYCSGRRKLEHKLEHINVKVYLF